MQISSLENTIRSRIALFLAGFFTLAFLFSSLLTLFDDPGADTDLVWMTLGLAGNITFFWWLVWRKPSPRKLQIWALMDILASYLILIYTAVITNKSMGQAAVLFQISCSFVVAVGFFTLRTWIPLVFASGILALFSLLFILFPWLFFPLGQDSLFQDPQRFQSYMVLFSGVILMGFLGIILLNHYLVRKIFHQLQEDNKLLTQQAFYDQETSLPNGRLLEKNLPEQIQALDIKHQIFVLAGFKITGLGEMNIRLGYEGSNRFLMDLAQTTQGALEQWVQAPNHFELYRVEGDLLVFSLVIRKEQFFEGFCTPQVLTNLVRSILAQTQEGAHLSFFGALDIYPRETSTEWRLHNHILNILHNSQEAHRMQFIPFRESDYQGFLRREQIKAQIRSSDFVKQLHTVFQPKVTADGLVCTGFEALVRWNSPTLGSVSPLDFIPLAENTRMIHLVTHRVEDQCRDLIQNLHRRGFKNFKVSYNISPILLVRAFLDPLVDWITHSGLGPWLELELTEGVLLRLDPLVMSAFQRLVTLGVKFSIDDFGTGYSNLSYLQNFAADAIKIDKRFIDNLPEDPKDASLVKAILQLAKAFGMATVAEGVETQAQARFLKDAGCDQIQGFLFAKPLPPEQAMEFFLNHQSPGPGKV